jgi:hypothetical protein
MDGLSQLTAAGHTVTCGGRTYHLSPLTLADYGEIENQIVAARADPRGGLRQRLAGMSAEEQEQELERVFDQAVAARRVTLGDLDQWWQTWAGLCYRFWLMIRKRQPSVELEEAAAILARLSLERRAELVRRMEACYGLPVDQPMGGPAEERDAAWRDAAPPWGQWACRLSRLYGWSPAELAALTIAQMWTYLTESCGPGACKRMAVADGLAYCARRRRQREQWIRQMMEKRS